MNKRVVGFALGAGTVALVAALAFSERATPLTGVVQPDAGVADAGDAGPRDRIVRFFVASTRAQLGALMAVMRHVDATLLPEGGAPSTMGDGTPIPPWLPQTRTLHVTYARPACGAVEYAVPMTAPVALEWANLRAACAARLDAGLVPDGGACNAIAAAPALVTNLPVEFMPDSGLCWWEDGGSNAPPAPPDDYPTETP